MLKKLTFDIKGLFTSLLKPKNPSDLLYVRRLANFCSRIMHKPYIFCFFILFLFSFEGAYASTDLLELGEAEVGRFLGFPTNILNNSVDTIPKTDNKGNTPNFPNRNAVDLRDPSNIKKEVDFDPNSNQYIMKEKIGDDYYRAPSSMSFEEYLDYKSKKSESDYFRRLGGLTPEKRKFTLKDPAAPFDVKKSLMDKLFGGMPPKVDIRPQGNVDLTFGVDQTRVDNPTIPLQFRTNGGFNFDMRINLNVTGKIGDKVNLSTQYNTQQVFNQNNLIKLNYNTQNFGEDDIVKKIEAGNVSMPLKSTLIQGAQSLMGVKTELQFGKLFVTALASQQLSKQQNVRVQGGGQIQSFNLTADQYEENRHFFVSHFNRNTFEGALQNIPQIRSLMRITRMEVWITNDSRRTEGGIRNIVAVADLGESERFTSSFRKPVPIRNGGLPANNANDIYQELINQPAARYVNGASQRLQLAPLNLKQSQDFEEIEARLLAPSEYTFNEQLGTLSLNINVQPDQILGVSYEYDYNGRTYKLGEFTNDIPTDSIAPNVLFVKMLKATTPRVSLPIWDLMMKNIYNIGAFQVTQQDFRLDIFYDDPGAGEKRFLPEGRLNGVPLLRVFNLDKLNTQGDPQPDGVFDFVNNLTISTRNGRVMFPVLEPFGQNLVDKIQDPNLIRKFAYSQLYDSTVFRAREFPELNRFFIRGTYKSSVSSEIQLGAFNIPQGSVRVSAAGQQLVEGRDFEIEYGTGKVRILNDGILASGTPVDVSFEDNAIFGFNNRTMLGTRFEYRANKNFNVGTTLMNLRERPFTQKVNLNEDPINNTVIGSDVSFSRESNWITKMVDKLPFYSTKTPSKFSLNAEAATILPGHSRAIRTTDEQGSVFIDDFEGTATTFDLRIAPQNWVISSVPEGLSGEFPESRPEYINRLEPGMNRAKLNWYRIDPVARSGPDNDNPYFAQIATQEIFPNFNPAPGLGQDILQTFDLHYYPEKRGPYNFDTPTGVPGISSGIETNGNLRDPKTRWGGIMRSITSSIDFEAANIEFLEFWLLDPFINNRTSGNQGTLNFDLGNISEDIMKDSRAFFENGLPTAQNNTLRTDITAWGRVPRQTPRIAAFETDIAARDAQDVGLDGLDDTGERTQFKSYLDAVTPFLASNVRDKIQEDPAGDNYVFYNDTKFNGASVSERYLDFNNPQGNSKASNSNSVLPEAATILPDAEDLNRDNSLNRSEAYWHYSIPIQSGANGLVGAEQFVTDKIEKNGRTWYRFKIPLQSPLAQKVGSIQDFRSIRFIRMYVKGFEQEVIFRFARLDLVRNQWRRYTRKIQGSTAPTIGNNEPDATYFDVNAVSIEQNGGRTPFSYVLPPGVQRERSVGAFPQIPQNEQAIAITTCNLQEGDSRAIFKNLNFDLRVYKNLRMFVHAEKGRNCETFPGCTSDIPEKGDLKLFLRLGSDYENNYYEYEVPIRYSPLNSGIAIEDPRYSNEVVWLPENNVDVPLELLRKVKEERNRTNSSLVNEFEMDDPNDPNKKIRVKGNPNLGMVRGAMIGLRNPSDGKANSVCAEVWVNELRVAGFDQRAAFAGIARADLQLADLGNITAATNLSSIGWGRMDQRVGQRQRFQGANWDFSGNLEMGKFLPEKSGIKLPLFLQYSNHTNTPEFDPYDLDLILRDKIRAAPAGNIRDSIRKQAIDQTVIKGYNLTNVRKERTNPDSKPMPWNIENFTFNYGYTETTRRTPIILEDRLDHYKGGFTYNYALNPKYILPFKKLVKKDKYTKLLTDFNFNLLPSNFAFTTNLDRQFNKSVFRFAGNPAVQDTLNTFFNKRFTWDRTYAFNFNPTKSIQFSFNAANNAVVDEPEEFNRLTGARISDGFRRDSIMQNLRQFGRPKLYTHNFNISYNLPFKQIPYMDWVQVQAKYSGSYGWTAAALNTEALGNLLQNTQSRQLNGTFNFENLYDKWKYLKRINRGPKSESTDKKTKGRGGIKDEAKSADPNSPTDPDKEKTRSKKDRPEDRIMKDMERIKDQMNPNTPIGPDGMPILSADSKDGVKKDSVGGKSKPAPKPKKKTEYEPSWFEYALIRPIMTIRRASFSYSENYGTIIPGFMPQSRLLGQNPNLSAPGFGFAAGTQPSNQWFQKAAQNNWISRDSLFYQPVLQNYTQQVDLKVNLEPFKDFKIDLEANRNYTRNHSEYFRVPHGGTDYERQVPRDVGTLNMTFTPLRTLFSGDRELFQLYEKNREVVSNRLGSGLHQIDPGYAGGFGKYQQDVLIPAFLSAYEKKNPANTNLDIFSRLPGLNWRLTYNGLNKLPKMKDIFASFSLTHSYRSNLAMTSYNTSLNYLSNPDSLNAQTRSYYSRFEVPNVAVTEAFSPLLGIDARLKNEMSFRLEYKRSRNLGMGFTDFQLAEQRTEELVIGYGYRIKNVYIKFLQPTTGMRKIEKKLKAKKEDPNKLQDPYAEKEKKDKKPKKPRGNDLNIKVDVSLRDDLSVNQQLDQGSRQITRGARILRVSPSVDYMLSSKLTLRIFVDHNVNTPKTSLGFPTRTTNGGITVRFTL
jgi:cell surface protein SprA